MYSRKLEGTYTLSYDHLCEANQKVIDVLDNQLGHLDIGFTYEIEVYDVIYQPVDEECGIMIAYIEEIKYKNHKDPIELLLSDEGYNRLMENILYVARTIR